MVKPTLFPTTAQGLPMDTPRLASAQARNSIFPQKTRRPLFPFLEQFGVDTPVAVPVESNITPQSLNASLDLNALKPKFQDVFLEDLVPRKPTAQELLAKALNDRAMAGREAVDLRRQELLDRGELGMQPVRNPALLETEIFSRMPTDQRHRFTSEVTSAPTATRVLPGIGHVTDFGDQGRVVTGRYGTGSVVNSAEANSNRTIEGIPAAEWFKQAANRQGISNKFAKTEDPGASPEARKERFKAREIV